MLRESVERKSREHRRNLSLFEKSVRREASLVVREKVEREGINMMSEKSWCSRIRSLAECKDAALCKRFEAEKLFFLRNMHQKGRNRDLMPLALLSTPDFPRRLKAIAVFGS